MLRRAIRVLTGDAPRVELISWRPRGKSPNFGDHLSQLLVARILATRGRSLEDAIPRHRFWQRSRRLLAIGSILHFARDGDAVWGSGRNGKIPCEQHRARTLDVRMVRGPLTRTFLSRLGIDAPAHYGEPGLLAARFLGGEMRPRRAEHGYVIVPNLHDLTHFEGAAIVSPLDPWEEVMGRIAGAPFVVGSSLHAIVVAESFGVPARLIRSQVEPLFKYQDYYLGTGRSDVAIASSVEEALDMGGVALPQVEPDQLLSTFPWDLWD